MNEETFNIKKLVIFVLLTISLLMLSFIYKSSFQHKIESYKVIRVSDGDTIEVEKDNIQYTVRLLGIDTPELHKPDTPIQCYAKEAQIFLEKIILNKDVTLVKDIEDEDVYKRKLRYVFLNDKNINQLIVENGFAYLYNSPTNTLYNKELTSAIKYAMNSKKGLWRYCTDKDTRVIQNLKQYNISYSSESLATEGVVKDTTQNCNIKGNVNSKKEKIYHLPGSIAYDKIVIDTSQGDQLFCNETDAVKSGFRKAKQ